MKRILKIITAIALAVLLFISFIASQIYFYNEDTNGKNADAAIVLGAAVWGEKLSPVFKERANHAINLYREKRIKKIIFTGGQGNADEKTEAETAREYAVAEGVSDADILIENKSRSTLENLLFAKPIAESNGIKTVFVVSDPLHLKRSIAIARDLNYEAYPSPTPTTKYRSFSAKFGLLEHETYFYILFLFRDFVSLAEI